MTAGLVTFVNPQPGHTQASYYPFTNVQFEDLQIYSDPTILKAPVVIDGREIFSVGKTGGTPAGERVALIRSELLKAIRDDITPEVKIEKQGGLPVLYLVYPRPPSSQSDNAPNEKMVDKRYLFSVTKEDTIGRKSNSQTAEDLKQEIEDVIAIAKKERSSAYTQRQGLISLGLLLSGWFISRLLTQLQTYPLRRAIQKVIPGLPSNTSSQPSNLTTLFRLKLGFAQFILWTAITLIIFRLFPPTRHWLYFLYSIVGNTFEKSVFSLGGTDFSLIRLAILVAL
ncbi:MAG: mechanosensitive ion channel protein MscS, partial [Cyanobacteria bacterium J06600_6]